MVTGMSRTTAFSLLLFVGLPERDLWVLGEEVRTSLTEPDVGRSKYETRRPRGLLPDATPLANDIVRLILVCLGERSNDCLLGLAALQGLLDRELAVEVTDEDRDASRRLVTCL